MRAFLYVTYPGPISRLRKGWVPVLDVQQRSIMASATEEVNGDDTCVGYEHIRLAT